MTNEDQERFQRIERNIEFIVQNQARFEQNQARFDQNQAQFDAKMRQIEQMHAALEEVVMKLAQSHVELVNSHKALAAAAAESERRLTRLAEAQAETGERLDAFIALFKKYIGGRNGGKQKN